MLEQTAHRLIILGGVFVFVFVKVKMFMDMFTEKVLGNTAYFLLEHA